MHVLDKIEQEIILPGTLYQEHSDGSSWERVWQSSHRYIAAAQRQKKTLDKIKILTKLGVEFRDKKVLDVGCGDGSTLQHLRQQYDIFGCGIDISPSAIRRSRYQNRYPDSIYYKVGDGRELPFAKASFDIVLSWGVIEHSDDFHLSIAEARRVLKTGGTCIFIQPHMYSFAVLQSYWLRARKKWRFGKQIHFRYRPFISILRRHGFSKIIYLVRPAPTDMKITRLFDIVAHAIFPKWGHYLYIIAIK